MKKQIGTLILAAGLLTGWGAANPAPLPQAQGGKIESQSKMSGNKMHKKDKKAKKMKKSKKTKTDKMGSKSKM